MNKTTSVNKDKVEKLDKQKVNDVLASFSCVNKNKNKKGAQSKKKCSHTIPFSLVDLYIPNYKTGKPYDKEQVMNRLDNICSVVDGKKEKCCKKDIPNSYIDTLPESFKDKYYRVKPEIDSFSGEITDYKTCSKQEVSANKCPNNYKTPTPYDYCKLSNMDNSKKVLQDCPEAPCNNDYTNILNYERNEEAIIEAYNLLKQIQFDEVQLVRKYFSQNPNMLNKHMLYGYPGNTAFMNAIIFKSQKCIDYFLTTQYSLNIQNSDNNTVLNLACLQGNLKLVNELLNRGADITIQNSHGDNAFNCAILSGNIQCVRLVLEYNPFLEIKNSKGETPLFLAVVCPNRNLEIINELLHYGANYDPLTTLNNLGETMLKVLLANSENTVEVASITTLLRNLVAKKYGDIKSEPIGITSPTTSASINGPLNEIVDLNLTGNKGILDLSDPNDVFITPGNQLTREKLTPYENIVIKYPEYSIVEIDKYLNDYGELIGYPNIVLDFPNSQEGASMDNDELYLNKTEYPIKTDLPSPYNKFPTEPVFTTPAITKTSKNKDEQEYKITTQVINSLYDEDDKQENKKSNKPCYNIVYFIVLLIVAAICLCIFVFYNKSENILKEIF